MLIPGATFIPESRVVTLPKNKSICPKKCGGLGLNGIQLK